MYLQTPPGGGVSALVVVPVVEAVARNVSQPVPTTKISNHYEAERPPSNLRLLRLIVCPRLMYPAKAFY